MHARLLLAAIVVGFTLSAQQGGASPRSATAARTGTARRHPGDGRSASIDDTQGGAAEDVSLLVGGFSPYPMPAGVARAMYAEPGETVYLPTHATDKPDASRARQPARWRSLKANR